MLVGGLEHFLFFHFIWDVILPIDELIFFKMVIAPESEKVNQQLGSDKTLATICNHGLFFNRACLHYIIHHEINWGFFQPSWLMI